MNQLAVTRRCAGAAAAVAVAVALAPAASADAPPAGCTGWKIEYALAANLQLGDTPFGQGDGVYAIGPGRTVLLFEDRDGQPGGAAAMTSYEMRESFTVKSRTLFATTTVVTDAQTRATPDACGVAASGKLKGTTLAWSSPLAGYRTDGTLTCEGSLCGKFGAPPRGTSELHMGPGPVAFGAFELSKDLKTFTMASTQVAKTEAPKQTAHVTLSGREMRRTCVQPPSCMLRGRGAAGVD